MKIEFHYGDGVIVLEIPEKNIAQVIRPHQDQSGSDNATIVKQAFGDSARQLTEIAAGKRVCILAGDGSRDMPMKEALAAILPSLVKASFVQFIECTGTHEACSPENIDVADKLTAYAKRAGLKKFDVAIHDCFDDSLKMAGITSNGTEIAYNALADEADLFIVLSDVKCHYFGGYSNPVKNFVPGICAYRTAEKNHSLALDERSTFGIHPWHADEARRDNPLACDQLEGMKMITGGRGVYVFATVSTKGDIQWAGFGRAQEVCAGAFAEVDKKNCFTVTPKPRLIVSPGGMPHDVDLYISQRALELTKNAVTKGGQVMFLSACPKGIGEPHTMENFYNRLVKPIPDILKSIEGEYKLFSHKPYKFAQMITSLEKLWVYSEIPDEQIAASHLDPTDNPQAVIDRWLKEAPDTEIITVDGANKIALYCDTD